ncbi:preprotein translocase subunit SCY2, chloroplastic isoform X1 [Cynara cardunculus var. scolymus]|uniref:preprotein translocase subunit SCY2, chloroplastic isoform X1 n=1 Tax=Cynara cardunculus var. scolymus TaxID=59895 RepID=UPI000D623EA2|nr:preprotein translocase subunit SCY2, chloroplastic isoform X1 [Cynara cardunculus var. scolymus]
MNLQMQSINPWFSNVNSSSAYYFAPQRGSRFSGGRAHSFRLWRISCARRCSLKANNLEHHKSHFVNLEKPFCSSADHNSSKFIYNHPRRSDMRIQAASSGSLNHELIMQTSENEFEVSSYNAENLQHIPKYENKFLIFVRLGSVINKAAESFFKSEIRRRLFITAALLVISRVGYFIPLPGFDRRLVPENYLSFVSGSVEELGELAPELKLSLFQLGISPQIGASIVMQVLCYVVPSLVKLRKEGLDANEKIKSYIWWMSLGFAILEALIISYFSLSYSIYAANASQRVKHVMLTTMLLVCGAMTTTWICDKISDSGFGHGSSLLICVNILTGYIETLHKMLSQLSGSAVGWGPYIFAVSGVFIVVTMWAVIVTQGCRKIKLQYYGFKLASSTREGSPVTEVEQYIPFNINPSGMQPVLTTSYLLGFPAIVASFFSSRFWNNVREILNPESSLGAAPWVYYTIYAFFVFLFNIFDIANMPKEIAEYLNKMGARIPNIKPGKATVEYLAKIQASTRFWGGLLLSILATSSTILDHYLRKTNEGFSIGFTSVLIIVGSIIELRRSYQAYNVMPSLSKALKRYGV